MNDQNEFSTSVLAPQQSSNVQKDFMKAVQGQAVGAPVYNDNEGDLSTLTLSRLHGKSLVNKDYIENLLKQPDVRKSEREIMLKELEKHQGKVPIHHYAQAVKKHLLPLTRNDAGTRWEDINLPEEERGINYKQHIYESPIQTSAANTHFNRDSHPGYFAHVRSDEVEPEKEYPTPEEIEQHMAEFKKALGVKAIEHNGRTMYAAVKAGSDDRLTSTYDTPEEAIEAATRWEPQNYRSYAAKSKPPETRRILEMQSDLMQRGRLDQEANRVPTNAANWTSIGDPNHVSMEQTRTAHEENINKLRPYEDTWHERLIQEEMRQAARDGMKFIQFPTGDTVAKIEGYTHYSEQGPNIPETATEGYRFNYNDEPWIVTRVMGDGVEAIPEDKIDRQFDYDTAKDEDINSELENINYDPSDFLDQINNYIHENWNRLPKETRDVISKHDKKHELLNGLAEEKGLDGYMQYKKEAKEEYKKMIEESGIDLTPIAEEMVRERYDDPDEYAKYYSDELGTGTYHIGDNQIALTGEEQPHESFGYGMIDPDDPQGIRDQLSEDQQNVYDFYEKDIAKYLRKIAPELEEITDDMDNSWLQVPVHSGHANTPVRAFSTSPIKEPAQLDFHQTVLGAGR